MRRDSIDLIKILNEDEENNRVFVHGKDIAESIEDALNNYDIFEYNCYYCNKPTCYKMKNWIAKNKSWELSDEEILDSLNGPYPLFVLNVLDRINLHNIIIRTIK